MIPNHICLKKVIRGHSHGHLHKEFSGTQGYGRRYSMEGAMAFCDMTATFFVKNNGGGG